MKPAAKFTYTTALSTLLLIATVPHAQAASITGPADAGRIGGATQQSLPKITKEAPLQVKGNAPFQAPAGAEKITFTLKEVSFEGMSAYTPQQLMGVYGDKLGQKISLADVYAIAANLTAKYRNDGYILTQVVVPPQTISDGIVRLRIVEGELDQIRIEGPGAQGSNADVIRLYVQELKSHGVLNNKNLEKTLLLINDLPGVTARSVLSPSKTKVGASDLSLLVERKPYDGTVGVNNKGSRFLGQWQATAGAALNSVLGYNERLEAQIAYAPSGRGVDYELLYGELVGTVPVGKYGTKVQANFGSSNTQPGHTLKEFDVLGQSRFGGVKVLQPIVRSREFNVSSTLGLDLRATKTRSDLTTVATEDKITALRVAGHMDFVDTLFAAAVTSANLQVSRGLGFLGASDNGDANLSRPDADTSFTKWNADVTRLERLTDGLALQTSLRGQMSNAALLSAEEFGIGGASDIGRGYDPSELVGDDGFAGSIELQWTSPYQISWLNSYVVYGFYDIGKVWNDDATSPSLREQSLASTGIGFKASLTAATHFDMMVAKPLTRDIAAENDDTARVYVGFSQDF